MHTVNLTRKQLPKPARVVAAAMLAASLSPSRIGVPHLSMRSATRWYGRRSTRAWEPGGWRCTAGWRGRWRHPAASARRHPTLPGPRGQATRNP